MKYEVKRTSGPGVARMSRGDRKWDEPRQSASIYADGRLVERVSLNSLLCALPEGGVRGVDATDDQLVRAILGDEHVFSGAPSYPEHHDRVLEG